MTRDRAPEDARGRVVMLTADGERLVDRLMADHMAIETTILSTLDREERQRLAGLLGKLLASVEACGELLRLAPVPVACCFRGVLDVCP